MAGQNALTLQQLAAQNTLALQQLEVARQLVEKLSQELQQRDVQLLSAQQSAGKAKLESVDAQVSNVQLLAESIVKKGAEKYAVFSQMLRSNLKNPSLFGASKEQSAKASEAPTHNWRKEIKVSAAALATKFSQKIAGSEHNSEKAAAPTFTRK